MAIARVRDPRAKYADAMKIVNTVGKLILNNRGVIRDITSLGAKPLPKIISKNQERHFEGYQFMIGFDSSAAVQEELIRTLRKDPRILRANVFKQHIHKNLNVGTSFEQASK